MPWSYQPWNPIEEEKARTAYFINLGRYGFPCPADDYSIRYWWEVGRQLEGLPLDDDIDRFNTFRPLDDQWKAS